MRDCPHCGEKMRVTETRVLGDVIYRNRKCSPCDWIVTTKEEAIEGAMPTEALPKRDWAAVYAERQAKSARKISE